MNRGLIAVFAFAATIALAVTAAAIEPLFEDAGFTESPTAAAEREAAEPFVERVRFVEVRKSLLENGTLNLNLFADADLTAVRDRIERRESGFTWFGHLHGDDAASVIVTVENGAIAANVTGIDGVYQVRPLRGNRRYQVVREIRQSAFPECLAGVPVELPAVDVAPVAAADDGSTIDVMVAYTQAVEDASSGIDAEIQLAIDESNGAFANSGVNHRFRLVRKLKVDYTESGNMSTDLSRLRSTSDGYIDEVHAARSASCADVISLWVESGDYCGIAYLMTSVNPSFASSAVSVVARDCATGYFSFGHEIGHNMGARHDRYVDNTNNSPYSYNHGHVEPPDRWRTVMAYNTECSDAGFNCTRIQYWSNPDVTYGGDPMGVPEGSSAAADNRQTLNNTAYTVANFRDSSLCDGTTPLLSFEANQDGSDVLATWETAFEDTTRGFNVLRAASAGGTYSTLNGSEIAATGSPSQGRSYNYRDGNVSAGDTFWYKLEVVEDDASVNTYGPVSVTVGEEPSPGCGTVEGNETAPFALLLLIALALAVPRVRRVRAR